MDGSYKLESFTDNKDSEVTRLKAQVDLFFEKEFAIYKEIGLKDGMDILECGSGPGFLIKNIKERLTRCKAVALEIDHFLFSVLRDNSRSGSKQLYSPVNESIYKTNLPDSSFDFIIARLVIEHLEEPLKAIFELNRILKPGGKLVIVSNDFAYHLLTYPVIPELNEMYEAYCNSRFSEGGNPLIGRQLPVYLKNANFVKVDFEIITAHSILSGDDTFLKAENVNISKSLVAKGFLKRNTLASLIEKWFDMLKDPYHVFYRQLFVASGEKTSNKTFLPYSESLENSLKKQLKKETYTAQTNKLDQQREKFKNLMNKYQQHPGTGSTFSPEKTLPGTDRSIVDFPKHSPDNQNAEVPDISRLETILLSVWKEILKNSSITIEDNYFDIGGDSVRIPEIVTKLASDFNIKIRILDVFDNPSISKLSDYIRNGNSKYS